MGNKQKKQSFESKPTAIKEFADICCCHDTIFA